MTLLDPQIWTGKCYDGGWFVPLGGERAVLEPATGTELGRVGLGNADDVARAGLRAAEAQRDWARESYEVRARVLRRAGDLWEEHAADVHMWLVREAGSTPAKAGVETHGAADGSSRPYGADASAAAS